MSGQVEGGLDLAASKDLCMLYVQTVVMESFYPTFRSLGALSYWNQKIQMKFWCTTAIQI